MKPSEFPMAHAWTVLLVFPFPDPELALLLAVPHPGDNLPAAPFVPRGNLDVVITDKITGYFRDTHLLCHIQEGAFGQVFIIDIFSVLNLILTTVT